MEGIWNDHSNWDIYVDGMKNDISHWDHYVERIMNYHIDHYVERIKYDRSEINIWKE